ncbi:MAG: adenylate/guanylate cyclase domain-containing protein, partial [Ginsengibacter sp.]
MIFVFFSVSILIAQDKYRAVHWGIDEGISFDQNNIILKDVKGFIWAGSSNGLNRFDGSQFKHFFPDKNKRGTIIGSNIYNLIEDSLHNIWIGTEKGMSWYDIKADTIRNIQPSKDALFSFIDPFWATPDKVYCIEPALSVTAYDVHNFTKKVLAQIPHEYAMGGLAHPVFDAKTNSVWLLEGFRGQPGGLFKISLSDGKTKHVAWPCYKNIPGHGHGSPDMCYDRQRNAIWLSTLDGLIEFTLDDEQFNHIDALNEISDKKDFIYPEGVGIDSQGRIWWCSFPAGLIIYDPSTQTFAPIFSDLNAQAQVGHANLFVYPDRDGMVWTSCSEGSRGIYQVIPASIPVFQYKRDSANPHGLQSILFSNFIKADHEKLLIGQADDLYLFDPQTGFFERSTPSNDFPIFKNKIMTPVMIDSVHQKALFDVYNQATGTSELYTNDISTGQWHAVVFRDTLGKIISPPPGYNVIPFKDGAVLFCEKGIFSVSIDRAVANWVLPSIFSTSIFSTDNDHFIFIRREEADNLTYSLINNKWTQVSSPVDSLSWSAIYFNSKDKTYWIGGVGEMRHYNSNLHLIHRYITEDGLLDEAVTGIIADNKNNIWIQYRRAIKRLNVKAGKITGLSEKDGLIKGSYGGVLKTYGDLFFFGSQGISRVNPDKLTENYPPSSVYFKSVEVNQKPYIISSGINEVKELSLSYDENKISIETGVIDYYSKGNGTIRYKLKSLHEQWQVSPANYVIRYDGLPPGKYTLEIEASNAGNDYNGPKKKLRIIIHPPYWQTWWFRILMGLILIFIFYAIYRLRTASLRKQKRILEQTVKERTAEVVEEKAQVEKQKDVIQKEKERSDELLLNILPSEVAEELKEKGYTTAKSFDEVTILFSDIKGFTHVAERMSPQDLVKEIDTYFSAFDRIMQQYGLEKIKTIGDAYIAAGGLPDGNTATTKKVIEAAIAMQKAVGVFIKEREQNNLPFFELRIGIHTGPVVAGVVGIKKFQYDIWGDT